MEDYTYDFNPRHECVLGSHMLEICPTIAEKKPAVEIHPLGIGGKEDPVRLVFNAIGGSALNATLIDLGNRFRPLVNEVTAIEPPSVPKLPVARAVWTCAPNLKTACAAWILAGEPITRDTATASARECLRISRRSRVSNSRSSTKQPSCAPSKSRSATMSSTTTWRNLTALRQRQPLFMKWGA